MSEKFLLGLDPGGKGCFGWCVVKFRQKPPLEIEISGVADNAGDAFCKAQEIIKDNELIGVAIDSPLFWHKNGDFRNVDRTLKKNLSDIDPRFANKVMQVNSLRGGCLMQGIMAARMIRDKYKEVPITESHPTAITAINYEYILDLKGLCNNEHEIDAAIACLSAWAMKTKDKEWVDMLLTDTDKKYYKKMVTGRLHYYLPKL